MTTKSVKIEAILRAKNPRIAEVAIANLRNRKIPALQRYAFLEGLTIANLHVKKVLPEPYGGSVRVLCTCTCGNEKKVVVSHLLRGHRVKCQTGTCHREFQDITGQTFHFLTAIKLHKFTPKGTFWFFRCVCGKVYSASRNAIIEGTHKSCGCKRAQLLLEHNIRKYPDKLPQVLFRAYNQHKKDALKRGLDSRLDFFAWRQIALQPCFYCGDISIRRHPSGKTFAVNSVDRLNNEKFYDETNARPACFVCQQTKMHMSAANFLAHAKKVVLHAKRKARK